MALRASWAEALFARLSVRYGAAFLRQYEGIETDAVKADWADVLDSVGADSIAYALDHLPADKPPTAMQFRDLCRRAPRNERPALSAPDVPAQPELVAQIAARLQAKPRGPSPAQQCYASIRAAVAGRGGAWSPAQIAQVLAMHRAGQIDASAESFLQATEDANA